MTTSALTTTATPINPTTATTSTAIPRRVKLTLLREWDRIPTEKEYISWWKELSFPLCKWAEEKFGQGSGFPWYCTWCHIAWDPGNESLERHCPIGAVESAIRKRNYPAFREAFLEAREEIRAIPEA